MQKIHGKRRNAPKGIVVISTRSRPGRVCFDNSRNAPKGIVVISTQALVSASAFKLPVVMPRRRVGQVNPLVTLKRNQCVTSPDWQPHDRNQ